MHIYGLRMGTGKKFRQGQILRLVSAEHIDSQDDLRRRLAHQRLRVTQATLSRDIHELKLVKTDDGYKPGAPLAEESVSLPPFTRAVREFLVDIRPAENLLVLKTPPGGAQPLAAALDSAKFGEVAGNNRGAATRRILTPTPNARERLHSPNSEMSYK